MTTKLLHEDDYDSRTAATIIAAIDSGEGFTGGVTASEEEQDPIREGNSIQIPSEFATYLTTSEKQALVNYGYWRQARGSDLPEDEEWMIVLAHYINGFASADFDVTLTEITYESAWFTTDERIAAVYMLEDLEASLIGRPSSSFLMSNIEGGGTVLLGETGDSGLGRSEFADAAFFPAWNYDGNPYYEGTGASKALAIRRRCMVAACVDMICSQAASGWASSNRTYEISGPLLKWAYTFNKCKSIVPPAAKIAFQQGLISAVAKLANVNNYSQHDLNQTCAAAVWEVWNALDADMKVGIVTARDARAAATQSDAEGHNGYVMKHDAGADFSYLGRGCDWLVAGILASGGDSTIAGWMNTFLEIPTRMTSADPGGGIHCPTGSHVGSQADFPRWQAGSDTNDFPAAYYCANHRYRAVHFTENEIRLYEPMRMERRIANVIISAVEATNSSQNAYDADALDSIGGYNRASGPHIIYDYLPSDFQSVVGAYTPSNLPLPLGGSTSWITRQFISGGDDDDAMQWNFNGENYGAIWCGDQGSRAFPGAGWNNTILTLGTPYMGPVVQSITRGHQNNNDKDVYEGTDDDGADVGVNKWACEHVGGTLANGNEISTATAARIPTRDSNLIDGSSDQTSGSSTIDATYSGTFTAMRSSYAPLTSGDIDFTKQYEVDSDGVTVTYNITADSTAQGDSNNNPTLYGFIPIIVSNDPWNSGAKNRVGHHIPKYEVDTGSGFAAVSTDADISGAKAVRIEKYGSKATITLDATAHPSGLTLFIDTDYNNKQTNERVHILRWTIQSGSSWAATTTFKWSFEHTSAWSGDSVDALSDLWYRVRADQANCFTEYGADFAGTDEVLTAGTVSDFYLGTGDASLAIYVARDGTGAEILGGWYLDANNHWEIGFDASDLPYFSATVGGSQVISVSGATAVDDTAYHSLVIVLDRDSAANTELYLDGSLDTSGTPAVSTSDLEGGGAGNFYLGFDGGTGYFDGHAEHFSGWAYVLPATFAAWHALGHNYENAVTWEAAYTLNYWYCLSQHADDSLDMIDRSGNAAALAWSGTAPANSRGHVSSVVVEKSVVSHIQPIQIKGANSWFGGSTSDLNDPTGRPYWSATAGPGSTPGLTRASGSTWEVSDTEQQRTLTAPRWPLREVEGDPSFGWLWIGTPNATTGHVCGHDVSSGIKLQANNANTGSGGIRLFVNTGPETNPLLEESGSDLTGTAQYILLGCTDGTTWTVERNGAAVTFATENDLQTRTAALTVPGESFLGGGECVVSEWIIFSDDPTGGAAQTTLETYINSTYGLAVS